MTLKIDKSLAEVLEQQRDGLTAEENPPPKKTRF